MIFTGAEPHGHLAVGVEVGEVALDTINKHKRRKKLRLNRHKKRTWQK